MKPVELYERIGYKKLMVVSLVILAACLASLVFRYHSTGEFFSKGVDLQGGIQLSIDTNQSVDSSSLESYLKPIFGDVAVRTTTSIGGNSVLIMAGEEVDEDSLLSEVQKYGLDTTTYSFEKIEASLGESFFVQSRTAITVAFLFMGAVVFIIFRKPVPSFAVILCAFSDIVSTIAAMNLFGISLSLASFAALLLVIGYSVDTDILLTTKMVKRNDIPMEERISGAFKTGITMTMTTLVALSALYLVSGATAIGDITSVLIIALLFDLPYTWLTNMGIVRWWVEKRSD